MANENKTRDDTTKSSYTFEEALKIADEILKSGKEKKYNIGAFVHGLTFALEYTQYVYRIPEQQIANVRRGCKKYFKGIENIKESSKK